MSSSNQTATIDISQLTTMVVQMKSELSNVEIQLKTLSQSVEYSDKAISTLLMNVDKTVERLQNMSIEITKIIGLHDTRITKSEQKTQSISENLHIILEDVKKDIVQLRRNIENIPNSIREIVQAQERQSEIINTQMTNQAVQCRNNVHRRFDDLDTDVTALETRLTSQISSSNISLNELAKRVSKVESFVYKVLGALTVIASGSGILYGILKVVEMAHSAQTP